MSDVWWIPTESGWGVNVIQKSNFLFVTFFIYDQAQKPVWYTAQLTAASGLTWSGPLYATTGAYFGGPFPPNTTIRQAGTATSNVSTLKAATLIYSVDGVVVTKQVTRQLLVNENYTGTRYIHADRKAW